MSKNSTTVSQIGNRKARNQKALNDAITLETLEARQLMTVINVTAYGAANNGTGNDQGAVQAALNAAKPGDTVNFPAGTYNFSGSVSVPSGVTVTGDSSGATHINFNLSGQDLYGFRIAGNAQNVTIENLDIVSSNGIVSMQDGQAYNNITITNNRLEYGGGVTAAGIEVMGLEVTVPNSGTEVTNNYFHDSHNNRNWVDYFASNSNFDHNTFYNINDGGQLEYMGANVSFSYNYGTYIHRMGQETAGSSSTVNFKVDGNVFYDYTSPYNDTEGVSICVYGTNTQIENNYFDANIAPGSSWGSQSGAAAGGINRFGYAIESSGAPGTVSGNTLVGEWAEDVSVMGSENVTNNKIYGGGLWGDIENEPGPSGEGSVTQSNNLEDGNANDAPAAPANTNSYLGVSGSNSSSQTFTSATTATTTSTTASTSGSTAANTATTATFSGTANGITGFTATVLSDNKVQLSWTVPNATLASATVQMVTTVGRQTFPSVFYQGNVASVIIDQLHAGWQYDFSMTGITTTGATVSSNVATIRTTGASTTAYTLSPIPSTGTLVNGSTITGSVVSASTSTTTTTTGSTGSTSTATTTTGTTTTGTTTTGSTTTGTTTTGSTTTGTTATAAVIGVTANVLSNNQVQLSWTNSNVTLTSASIQIITTVGRQTFPAVVVNGNVSTATIDQLHAGWQYDFTIVGTTSTGATVTSNVVTVRTTGNSVPAYTLSPVLDVPAIAPPATVVSTPVTTTTTAPATGTTTGTSTGTGAWTTLSGLNAIVLSDTSVQLSWNDPSVGLTSALVNIITTVGRQSYPGVTVTGDATGVTINGLHAGWQYDFSVVGTGTDGSTILSQAVTVMMTGSSTAASSTLGMLSPNSVLLAA